MDIMNEKAVHETTTTYDDKRLESTLKRIGANSVPFIEEVNIFKDDTVIQILSPQVQASAINTWVVSGTSQTKNLREILPAILNQLGADNLANLRRLAKQLQEQAPVGAGEGAGETFEAAAEEGQKS